MNPIRVIAVLTLAVVAGSAAPHARQGGGPEPEIRAHVDAFVAVLTKGTADQYETMAREHFAPPLLARATPADRRAMFERIRSDFERSYSPAGFTRQYAAAAASPDRRPKLATITAPTVVIHGAVDPLVPLAGGQDTAANIPGAELRVVDGMGHDFPVALYDTIVEGIMRAVERAKAEAA